MVSMRPDGKRRMFGMAPDADDFVCMAEDALDAFPAPFREHAARVSIRIEDLADDETLEMLKIENPYELTGLYSGVAMTLEQHSAPSTEPAIVWLYRLAILDEWSACGDVDLEDLVGHVLVHELGHHFGWSDEDMERVLDAME